MPWSKAHEGYREEAKYAATWLGILQNFPSEFTRRDAVQPCKKSLVIDQVMNKKIKRAFVFREITKRGTHWEKRGWFVDLKKPSSVRSTCGKWLLLRRLPWKLSSCLGEKSVFSLKIFFKVCLLKPRCDAFYKLQHFNFDSFISQQ